MALNRISEVLVRMRENTKKISAAARAEMAHGAVERAAVSQPRCVIVAMGSSARGRMKKERYCK